MALTADDGTILKPKEGVVLDRDGQPLTATRWSASAGGAHGRAFSFSLPVPAIIGAILFVPLALAMGLAFFSVIGVLALVFVIFSTISRIFNTRPHR